MQTLLYLLQTFPLFDPPSVPGLLLARLSLEQWGGGTPRLMLCSCPSCITLLSGYSFLLRCFKQRRCGMGTTTSKAESSPPAAWPLAELACCMCPLLYVLAPRMLFLCNVATKPIMRFSYESTGNHSHLFHIR